MFFPSSIYKTYYVFEEIHANEYINRRLQLFLQANMATQNAEHVLPKELYIQMSLFNLTKE